MEKTVKISILRRKKEFKMEKTAEIFILGRKREFKMEKTVKISILGIGKVAQTEKKDVNVNIKMYKSDKIKMYNYSKLTWSFSR